MAKVKKTAKAKRDGDTPENFSFPLGKTNFLILGAGLAVLILGYVFMAWADHPDDFTTVTLAPILLMLAFAVLFPIGIMYRKNGDTPPQS